MCNYDPYIGTTRAELQNKLLLVLHLTRPLCGDSGREGCSRGEVAVGSPLSPPLEFATPASEPGGSRPGIVSTASSNSLGPLEVR